MNEEHLLTQASDLESSSNWEGALSCYQQILSVNTNHLQALSGAAKAQTKLGNLEDSLSYYQSALKISPDNISILNNYGAILNKLGKKEEALSCFDKIISIDSTRAKAWMNRGKILVEWNYFENAISSLDKAISLDHSLINPYLLKANALVGIDHLQEALNCYDDLLKINSELILGWIGKGDTLVLLKRYGEAFDCYYHAIIINQQDVYPWICIAELYEKCGFDDRAIKCYNTAMQYEELFGQAFMNKISLLNKLVQNKQIVDFVFSEIPIDNSMNQSRLEYSKLFLALLGTGFPVVANSCETILQSSPNYYKAIIIQAYFELVAGNDKSEQMLKQALSMEPNCKTALILLGYYFRESGRIQQATDYFEQARKAISDKTYINPKLTVNELINPEFIEKFMDQCEKGDLEIISHMLDQNAGLLNCTDIIGDTPLNIATAFNNIAIVRCLLSRRTDVNVRGVYGRTALHSAGSEGSVEIMRLLINNGAEIDIQTTDERKWTPLHVAAIQGQLSAVETLLEYGANPDITDGDGMTALQNAELQGHEDVARILRVG
jgi:tetratricopeptide (TPR) repeat protein